MRPPPPDTSTDRVSDFCYRVLDGSILAGPYVRDACVRHLLDRMHGHERGLVWDQAKADHAIGFFEDVLPLNGGEYEAVPFLLAPWQAFVVGSLFGWYTVDGFRRFSVGYLETGKGSGKSPLAAGIGLYGLMSDGEQRAEVYAAATKRDQAQILFRDAVAMVNLQSLLGSRLVQSGRDDKVWNLFYDKTNSFFRCIGSDDGQSGPRPHIALIDEVHEHKTPTVVNMMKAGRKNRRRALLLMITNSGSDKKTVCGTYHDLGVRVCRREFLDDSLFAFICALDKGDDPFVDEGCWPKVNPSLDYLAHGQTDGIPGRRYLREQVNQARGAPSQEAIVKRLNFCKWTEAESPWISWEVWGQASGRLPPRALRGRPAVAGLDLSSTTDLTAFAIKFFPTAEDPHWRLVPYFWIPDHQLLKREENDRVPYSQWIKEKWLETTPGRAISKLHVLRRLQQICAFYDIRKIAYDRWRIEDLKMLMGEHGITLPPMEPFGQGYVDMGPAVDEFERRLLGVVPLDEEGQPLAVEVETLRHDGNPVMTWCAGNAVVISDPANNRKVDKSKSIGRVDGIVAGVMAAGISSGARPGTGKSVYEEEGVGI
ncbi:MAG: terminase large subunit [Acidovorax sp.]